MPLYLYCRRDRASFGPWTRDLLKQHLLESLPRLNRLLLTGDHAVEEALKALFEILDALLLKPCYLALDKP
jgi:hypothetical protein